MNKLLSFVLMCLCAFSMKAQTKAESIQVFYPYGGTSIHKSYKDNAAQLQQMNAVFAKDSIDWSRYRVVITASSSPEGSEAHNEIMSQRRASALANYLFNQCNVPQENIVLESHRVDWTELRRMLTLSPLGDEANPYVDYLDSVIARINDGETVKDVEVLSGIRKAYQGWKYPYIRKYVFPQLRYAKVELVPIRPQVVPTIPAAEPTTKPETIPQDTTRPEYTIRQDTDTTKIQHLLPVERKPLYLALKTNLLYDALLTPNIGVEWAFDKHWSVNATWMYAWWSNYSKHRFWRIYGGDLEVRYWLGGPDVKPLTGHHFGVYGGILTYDFEFGGKGYLGDRWSYDFGVSYGYSMPIARRLNLDFVLGIGYLGGKYYEYRPNGDRYLWQATKQRKWFGPTRAEVTLTWLLGHGNTNDKKNKTR